MKILLLDLWNDLRAKRIWPVAIVLLAALVAVPVLLAKPAEHPKSPPAASVSQAKTADQKKLGRFAQVRLADEEPGDGSTLGVFDPDNPFTPPKGAVKKESDQARQSDAGPSDSSTPASGDTGSGGGGGSGGSGETPQTPSGGDDGKTQTASYRYVIDVTFTANGHTRHIKGLEKLDMLPNQAAPLLIFLGVTDDAGNAVFLVDSTLQAAGEGRCKPSADDCAFLYLGAGSEHEFTNDDGDSYRLRIDEIRKVKIDASASSSSHEKGKSARAAVGAPAPPRRFVPPVLADLVSTSTGDSDNSTGRTGRR
jgi:hypothetical protein